MPLAAHRQSPNRARELSERAWALVAERLGGKTICDRCHATYGTQAELCLADLGETCPGLREIDMARQQAEKDIA